MTGMSSLPQLQLKQKQILTFNLSDFPAKSLNAFNIVALHPDEFLQQLVTAKPTEVCLAARRQRASLRKPPLDAQEFLATLENQGLPKSVDLLQEFADRI